MVTWQIQPFYRETNSQRTKETGWGGEREKRKKKVKHRQPRSGSILLVGQGVGRNLRISVHATQQWDPISMPSLNELSFLLRKNHSLHPLAQAWTVISQTLSVPTEVHPGGERLLSHANNSIVSDAFKLPGGLWEGELEELWNPFSPGSLTPSCPRALLPLLLLFPAPYKTSVVLNHTGKHGTNTQPGSLCLLPLPTMRTHVISIISKFSQLVIQKAPYFSICIF